MTYREKSWTVLLARRFLLVALGTGCLVAVGYDVSAKPAASTAADAENEGVAKAHGGAVWLLKEQPSDTSGPALSAWLSSAPRAGEFRQDQKDGPWNVRFMAVFKKPCVKGALTVKFFEKGDAKNVIDMYSPSSAESVLVFRGVYDLSPDLGFNKNRSYVIKVGQTLKGKFVPYASGAFSLK